MLIIFAATELTSTTAESRTNVMRINARHRRTFSAQPRDQTQKLARSEPTKRDSPTNSIQSRQTPCGNVVTAATAATTRTRRKWGAVNMWTRTTTSQSRKRRVRARDTNMKQASRRKQQVQSTGRAQRNQSSRQVNLSTMKVRTNCHRRLNRNSSGLMRQGVS